MAFTVAIKGNATPINDGESASDWTGLVPGDVTSFFKYGTQCVGFELWGSGTNDTYITGSWDFSSNTHLRWWMMTTVLNELDTDANGGIQVYMSDGSNTGYWKVSGSTTYPGGWYNPVIDTARACDSGTKPTMSAITTIGFRFVLTGSAKKVQSLWMDSFTQSDGLIVYGNDAAAYADFDDIFTKDSATTLATGIIRKIGGVFYLTGCLEFGKSASATEDLLFQALSQDVVFENRPVGTSLYTIEIVDDGSSYTTKFVLGDKVGAAGVQGCKIRVESSSQAAKFSVDAKTDTDVDFFKLYGSTFYGAGGIVFAKTATNVDILSCSFEACGQVDPYTAQVRKCFFISTTDTGGAILWNASIDLQDCTFIGNTTGAGIEHPAAGTFGYTDMIFSGNTYDVNNSSSASVDDSYPDSNGSGGYQLDGSPTKLAQTFTSGGGVLTRAIFSLIKYGTPTGNMKAELYATSGGAPTGSALATSNIVPVSVVGTGSYGLVDFEFEDEYTMVASTVYAIAIDYTGTATDYISGEIDAISPTHGGDMYIYTGSWTFASGIDLIFYVHDGGLVKINATDSTVSTATESATTKGATKIVSSVDVTITVIDEDNDPIQDAQTSVWTYPGNVQIMNEDTTALGVATESYPGSVPQQVVVKVRKSDDLDDPRYFPYSGIDTIGTGGLTKTVVLKVNPFI